MDVVRGTTTTAALEEEEAKGESGVFGETEGQYGPCTDSLVASMIRDTLT